MIKTVLAATVAALLTFTAPAYAQFTYTPKSSDDVGLYLGTQIWQSEASGIFGEENTLIDFNLTKEQQMHYFLAVKHPVSFLPHARIATTTLDTSGNTTLTQPFGFDDQTFPVGGNLNTSVNLSYVDYTLYYELFDDEIFSFELGVTARDLSGDVTVSGPTTSPDDTCNDPNPTPGSPCGATSNTSTAIGNINTNDMMPMLYAATSMKVPLTHLSVFAQAHFSFKDDPTFSDYQVGFNYDLMQIMMVDVHLNLGYRVVKMDFENLNSLYTDIQLNGAFVGMAAHF